VGGSRAPITDHRKAERIAAPRGQRAGEYRCRSEQSTPACVPDSSSWCSLEPGQCALNSLSLVRRGHVGCLDRARRRCAIARADPTMIGRRGGGVGRQVGPWPTTQWRRSGGITEQDRDSGGDIQGRARGEATRSRIGRFRSCRCKTDARHDQGNSRSAWPPQTSGSSSRDMSQTGGARCRKRPTVATGPDKSCGLSKSWARTYWTIFRVI